MQKIKLLVITDDIRMPTGVGIHANKFLKGLDKTGKYDVVSIAGSILRQPPDPVMYDNIKLYPTNDVYGNPNLLRQVMRLERPDLVLISSDPRFFVYVFDMDNEIRSISKLLFYHPWDNDPFPKYNLPWYSACDEIIMESKFSYDLMKNNGVSCHCIPVGVDTTEFHPLIEKQREIERVSFIKQIGLDPDKVKFIVFWNNRNITRKRPADVIEVFKQFHQSHPDSILVMNTAAVDRDGTDLIHLVHDVYPDGLPVVFIFQRMTTDKLNNIYNIADVTLNIAYNEGFGLCIAESLSAETPVIATRTGGMIEQVEKTTVHPAVHSDNGPCCDERIVTRQFGVLIDPAVKELYGVPGMPYIFRDFVSYSDVVNALGYAYTLKKRGDWKQYGVDGRKHIVENFNIDLMVKKWDELLQQVHSTPSMYKKWKMSVH